MTTLNDARFDALRAQGFTGATNDMLLEWLKDNSGTGEQINDLWLSMIQGKGIAGARNDVWYSLLGILGFEGSINDRELAFWAAGGILPPELDAVWDDILNWDDDDTWDDVFGPGLPPIVGDSLEFSPIQSGFTSFHYGYHDGVGGAVPDFGPTPFGLIVPLTIDGQVIGSFIANSFNDTFYIRLTITSDPWPSGIELELRGNTVTLTYFGNGQYQGIDAAFVTEVQGMGNGIETDTVNITIL